MENTEHYGLLLPEKTDTADMDDVNANMISVDNLIYGMKNVGPAHAGKFMKVDSEGVAVPVAVPVAAATTYNTSSSNRSIAAGQYLSGEQTIKGVKTANISAGNIKKGVTIQVGDDASAGRIASVTGSYTGSERIVDVITVLSGIGNTVRSGYTDTVKMRTSSGFGNYIPIGITKLDFINNSMPLQNNLVKIKGITYTSSYVEVELEVHNGQSNTVTYGNTVAIPCTIKSFNNG